MIEFCVPGFSKCGTTTLCDLLASHPEIFIPQAKEPGYFAENYARGKEWYLQSFFNQQNERLRGDGSTTYSSQEFADVASDRILEQSPDCKFIFIARNPRSRLESSFREMHASGHKYGILPDFEFGKALQQLPNMIADTLYWKLISVFRQKLPDAQMHVLFLEELQRDPVREIHACLDFLGVPRTPLERQKRQLNTAEHKMCDTHLLRWLQTNRFASLLWRQLSPQQQEWFTSRLSLRNPFSINIVWDDYAKDVFNRVVKPDAIQFLAHYGKPSDFWNLNFPHTSPAARAA